MYIMSGAPDVQKMSQRDAVIWRVTDVVPSINTHGHDQKWSTAIKNCWLA